MKIIKINRNLQRGKPIEQRFWESVDKKLTASAGIGPPELEVVDMEHSSLERGSKERIVTALCFTVEFLITGLWFCIVAITEDALIQTILGLEPIKKMRSTGRFSEP